MQYFLKEKLKCGLYIVSTPIGNLGDITLRAIEILKKVDLIMCEDTRITAKLLQKFKIKKPMRIYNENSGENEREKILDILRVGKPIALVSDAGTPLISDPGYKLVRKCIEQNIYITPIPGVSAVTTALSCCGLPTDRFMFCGFLSPKKISRRKELKKLSEIKTTFVFYESPNRLPEFLTDVKEIMHNPICSVLKELTKLFEEIKIETAKNLLSYYVKQQIKGEVVIIVDNHKKRKKNKFDIKKELQVALKTMSLKDAVQFVSENSGISKKEVYKRALEVH